METKTRAVDAAKKTHWKKLHNPDYLGSYSLDDNGKYQDLTVTIESVEKINVKDPRGGSQECIVANLKGSKPMILNVTNCNAITKLCNSPYIEDWAGKKITITVEKIKAFGEWVDALRIKDKASALPTLTPEHKGWENAKKAVLSGQYTIDQVKKKYSITPENEKLLCEVQI